MYKPNLDQNTEHVKRHEMFYTYMSLSDHISYIYWGHFSMDSKYSNRFSNGILELPISAYTHAK